MTRMYDGVWSGMMTVDAVCALCTSQTLYKYCKYINGVICFIYAVSRTGKCWQKTTLNIAICMLFLVFYMNICGEIFKFIYGIGKEKVNRLGTSRFINIVICVQKLNEKAFSLAETILLMLFFFYELTGIIIGKTPLVYAILL